MITLNKLNGNPFALNCDMIETIAECPDTTIRMNNGNVYIVENSMEEVIGKIKAYRKDILSSLISQSFDKN